MLGKEARLPLLDPEPPVAAAGQRAPLRVAFSAQTVSEILALGNDSVSNGASPFELGGLLFGVVTPKAIQVKTVRQLPASQAASGFAKLNRKMFDELMRSVKLDSSLDGLRLVGWYRFHGNEGELRPDPLEIDFHDRFFQQNYEIGLLLKTEGAGEVTGRLCTRSQDGAFSPTQHSSTALRLNDRRITPTSVDIESGPLFTEATYFKAYQVLEDANTRQTRRKAILIGFAALVCVAVLIVAVGRFVATTSTAPEAVAPAGGTALSLSVTGSALHVNWTGGMPSAKQAWLDILDGNRTTHLDVSETYHSSGTATVLRHSRNIQVVMTMSDGYRRWQTQSSLIADAPADEPENAEVRSAASAPGPKNGTEAELTTLREKNRRLEATVAALRRRASGRARK